MTPLEGVARSAGGCPFRHFQICTMSMVPAGNPQALRASSLRKGAFVRRTLKMTPFEGGGTKCRGCPFLCVHHHTLPPTIPIGLFREWENALLIFVSKLDIIQENT